jgi:molybdate transport system substrate-binding protein
MSVANLCQLRKVLRALAAVVTLVSGASHFAMAADTNVAVAANFTEPVKEIAELFAQKTGHKAILSFGATGQFYAQITQGAPFQVLLSADQATPKKLAGEGLALGDSQFTYAVGKLVLFSMDPNLVTGAQTLSDGKFDKIAIANPASAPYGAAAVETMKALGVYDKLSSKIVQGSNINQAFQFVQTHNAELGFVALSQLVDQKGASRWIVGSKYHSPISQDAVLLKAGSTNEAAKAFLAFLQGPEAGAVIERFGYDTKSIRASR